MKNFKTQKQTRVGADDPVRPSESGITLIALVVTIFFSYDEYKKYSNNNSFLLATI